MKPRNWGRVDDHDLYLILILKGNHEVIWVDYIVIRMAYCRDNKKAPLIYSSLVIFILEVNGIMPKEDEDFFTPNILNYGGVSKMRYYRDSEEGSYFYLEESGIKVYDDKIIDPSVDSTTTPAKTVAFDSLFAELKGYPDNLIGRIITAN